MGGQHRHSHAAVANANSAAGHGAPTATALMGSHMHNTLGTGQLPAPGAAGLQVPFMQAEPPSATLAAPHQQPAWFHAPGAIVPYAPAAAATHAAQWQMTVATAGIDLSTAPRQLPDVTELQGSLLEAHNICAMTSLYRGVMQAIEYSVEPSMEEQISNSMRRKLQMLERDPVRLAQFIRLDYMMLCQAYARGLRLGNMNRVVAEINSMLAG
jgi:hypothetical protein